MAVGSAGTGVLVGSGIGDAVPSGLGTSVGNRVLVGEGTGVSTGDSEVGAVVGVGVSVGKEVKVGRGVGTSTAVWRGVTLASAILDVSLLVTTRPSPIIPTPTNPPPQNVIRRTAMIPPMNGQSPLGLAG